MGWKDLIWCVWPLRIRASDFGPIHATGLEGSIDTPRSGFVGIGGLRFKEASFLARTLLFLHGA